MIKAMFSAALLFTVPAYSHHSALAVFTEEDIVVDGYVTKFLFKNPHVSVYIDVVGKNGAVEEWMATGPATPSLQRAGWAADTLQVGQYLRLSGKKGRNNRPMVLLAGSDITAGKAIMGLSTDNGSALPIVGVQTGNRGSASAEIDALAMRLPGGRPNLSGQWFGGLKSMITDQKTPPLNEKGAAVQVTFDPINDPTFSACSGDPGLVRQAVSILPQRITQKEDHVLIEYESFASRRMIYLDGHGPVSDVHTHLGNHIARYDGDKLVIETTQLLGNLAGAEGNALSDQTTAIETYRRADREGSGPILELTMVVTDPGHLREPWTIIVRKTYAPDYIFAGRDCQLPLLGPDEVAGD